jgi:hypothetical protein
MSLTYYKIRKKSDPELFRKADGSWSKSGKVYDSLGRLRAIITQHMNSVHSGWAQNELSDWDIVEYEVRIKEVKHLADVIDPKKIFELLGK